MKLLKPATRVEETVSLEKKVYPSFSSWLRNKPVTLRQNFAGASTLSPAIIDFELTPCVIGLLHTEDVAFGEELYEGIIPIELLDGSTYRCVVQNVRRIRIEASHTSR